MVAMVVFDVGETLVDETRQWGEWADWLGVPRFTFFGLLGGLILQGRSHREVFALAHPGLDRAEALARRRREGWNYEIRTDDFYPDALPCLRALRMRGLRIGVVGNQPEACERSLEAMGIPVDLLGSSERWGVEKPAPAFFARIVAESGLIPGDICYVGDRPDIDIRPAREAGLKPVFVRRGPWAILHENSPDAAAAAIKIESLAQLPERLGAL